MSLERLYQKFENQINATSTVFKRYLYDDVQWDSRLIGIVGPRGTGKTTLMLQYIKEELNLKKALYVSADDLYFANHSLYDLAEDFYQHDGKHLFIDEIHKYPEWSPTLKNIYDSFPKLKIVFTGSSVLEILKGTADLSRRALMYHLQGLSFREYLNWRHGQNIQPHALTDILKNNINIGDIEHPLPLFKDYLNNGYYPFAIENGFTARLDQVILQTLETDIPQFAQLSVSTSRKLKHLLTIIAESVPFKPNFSKIAEILGVSRNSLEDYFLHMEKAGLIVQVRNETKGIRALGKVSKVYLDNPNLAFHLAGNNPNAGNIRETFFANQMRLRHSLTSHTEVDFSIGDFYFEIGGKGKGQNQLPKDKNAFVVKDNIETGLRNTIPLWTFGLNY